VRRALLAAVGALLLAAQAAPAAILVDGGGRGHGVGLSQYGAYGYALREGRDAAWILSHYYRGTTLGRVDPVRVRVRLRRAPVLRIWAAGRARDARGRRIALREGRTYRFARVRGGRVRVSDPASRRALATLAAPVRVTGGPSVGLRGPAENGVRDGRYRGALVLHRDGTRLLAVNDVHVRDYLAGVVPAEMPATWPAEALKAQAIAARSYVMRRRARSRAFDVYSDARSQAYRGAGAETPATTRAVRATDGTVVRSGPDIAETLYSSSSGGVTAANEELFDPVPISYLRPIGDPYDDLSPDHAWRVTLPEAVVQRRLGDLVLGTLQGLDVIRRGASGRVLEVEVRGSAGGRLVSGTTIRNKLGLRSTLFATARG
jgi:stage II sporulation protein D